MTRLRKLVASAAIVTFSLLGVGTVQVVNSVPAVAYSNLCVTHFSRMAGPSGYHSHTVGNFVDGTDYKIVQYFKAGPGYIYLAKTARRWCG